MNEVLAELPILLIVIPLAGVPLLFLVDKTGRSTLVPAFVIVLSVLALVAFSLSSALGSPIETAASGWPADLGIHLRFDTLSAVTILVTSSVVLAALVSQREEPSPYQYHTLLLLLFAGSNGLVVTQDLFNAYVFIEITSIASYALVAQKQDQAAFESAFKYVVMGTLAGLVILWGIAGLYLTTGSLDLGHVSEVFDSVPGSVPALSVAALLAGILMKLGQIPFHPWKADSLSGASHAVAATLSGVTTTAFFVLLLRVLAAFPSPATSLRVVLSTIAGASVLVGHLMALRQTNYSRLLAYSSIAHIGYGVLAVSTGSGAAVAAGLFHILVHAIMKAGLFFLGPGVHQSGSGDESSGTVLFPRRYKWLYATVYCVLAMSMIGIPPVLGFTSKWHAVLETARAGSQIGAVLVAVGGAIALVYYLRFGLQLSSPVARDNAPEMSKDAEWVPPAVAALLVFALAFFSESLIGLCVQAVDQLTGAVW